MNKLVRFSPREPLGKQSAVNRVRKLFQPTLGMLSGNGNPLPSRWLPRFTGQKTRKHPMETVGVEKRSTISCACFAGCLPNSIFQGFGDRSICFLGIPGIDPHDTLAPEVVLTGGVTTVKSDVVHQNRISKFLRPVARVRRVFCCQVVATSS